MYQINALNPKDEGHHTRKRFGQNFLHDQRVIAKIVRSVNPRSGDNIVEIGPGLAALTSPLIGECDALTVVELDRDLAAGLPGRVPHPERLTIVETDALKYDFTELFQEGRPLRVVGNLPYNISTPLLFHLFEYADEIDTMHFMLQKEVVERMTASHGSKDYGRLSVMTQFYCKALPVVQVGPGAFKPAPKVDSAVVRLLPFNKAERAAVDPAILNRVCLEAFNQRRKTLRNCFSNFATAEQLQALGIDPSLRPEQLAVADFIHVAQWLATQEAGYAS